MNKWIGLGRLTADPEISTTAGGTMVARYTLAVNRPRRQDGQQEADFLRCIAFGKGAEFVKNHLFKGIKIAVIGRIQTGSYEKDGVRFYTTDIVVDEHHFCESKRQDTAEAAYVRQERRAIQQEDQSGYIQVDEEELPF